MKYKTLFHLFLVSVRKYWLLLFFLPVWACNLDKRIIVKEKKTEVAQTEHNRGADIYELHKKAIYRVVAYSPEAWEYLGSFLSDKKADNIRFIESILKDTATYAEGAHLGDGHKITKYGLAKPHSMGNGWAKNLGNKTPFEYYKLKLRTYYFQIKVHC